MGKRLNRYFKKGDTQMANRNILVKKMQIKNHIERPLRTC